MIPTSLKSAEPCEGLMRTSKADYLETETQVGDTVEVTIIRDGEKQSVQVVLAERPQ